jgi:hypothetical protein
MVFLSIGSKQIEHSSLLFTFLKYNLLINFINVNIKINNALNTMYIKDVIISIIENKQIRNNSLLSFRIIYSLFDTDCSVVII